MEYGDILLYTDAGCHINEVGKNMFLAYIKEVKKHPSGFLVFGARKGSLERQYTKVIFSHTLVYKKMMIFIIADKYMLPLFSKKR